MTSTIKVDNIQDQDGNNIINENSNTITVGASGDTIIIPSGATITNNGTQNGFGRTGTVDWQTGSIKTSTFTATNGEGYFCNTTSSGFTVNLPAGSAGAIVSVQDYNNTFDSNALTITPNGSEKINGGAAGGSLNLSTEGQGLTLVYVDSTVGWRAIEEQSFATSGSVSLIATGGTITTSGNYKIHTFTGPGTFTVCQVSGTPADNTVSYLVVAGGGSGSPSQGGVGASGGGAGGFREYKGPADCYTASPKNGNPGGTAVTVTAQAYPITVGGGGAANPTGPTPAVGNNGNNSVFSTITSAGGGFGAGGYPAPAHPPAGVVGGPGGSGGGGGTCTGSATNGKAGGTGNTPPVSPSQGNPGGVGTTRGSSPYGVGGGGGGASTAGDAGGPDTGNGGPGATTHITGSPVAYAGGGGGGWNGSSSGGTGGGGGAPPNGASNGTDNTGGGGSGSSGNSPYLPGGLGGSGIVVIRYKFQ